MAGVVYVDGKRVDKAGASVSEGASIEVRENPLPFVSRGGLKLQKALEGRFSPMNFCSKAMAEEELARLKK